MAEGGGEALPLRSRAFGHWAAWRLACIDTTHACIARNWAQSHARDAAAARASLRRKVTYELAMERLVRARAKLEEAGGEFFGPDGWPSHREEQLAIAMFGEAGYGFTLDRR